MVQGMITCSNMFPSKNGIASEPIPAAIILGYPNPDCNKLNNAQVYIGTANSKNIEQ